jgi:hypothetical protein
MQPTFAQGYVAYVFPVPGKGGTVTTKLTVIQVKNIFIFINKLVWVVLRI